MLHKVKEKIKNLLKNKDIRKQKHEDILLKMKQKLKKLDGKKDEDS